MTFLMIGVFLALLVAGVWLYIRSLDGQQKTAIKDSINGIFVRAERKGRFRRQPAFETDYLRDYPALRPIEEDYEIIREECDALMEKEDREGTSVESRRNFSLKVPTLEAALGRTLG